MLFTRENDIKLHITLAQFKHVRSKNIYLYYSVFRRSIPQNFEEYVVTAP